MKIKLIYPPANKSFGNVMSPSYHIATLGSILKEHEYDVCADDLEVKIAYLKKVKKYDLDIRALSDFNKVMLYLQEDKLDPALGNTIKKILSLTDYTGYEIFGFQVNTLQQFCVNQLISALCCAKYIKKGTGTKVFLFGHYPVDDAKKILMRFGFLDGVLYYEPEVSIVRIVEIFKGKRVKNCANLYYRNNNKIYGDGAVENVDLNQLPCPEFDLLPLKLFRKFHPLVLPYEISRGCPNRCFFCFYIYNNEKPRFKSAQKIIKEIKIISKTYHTKKFHFLDASINNNKAVAEEIFKQTLFQKTGIQWTGLATPRVADKDFYTMLRRSGCKLLRWGVESGSTKILSQLDKRLSVERMESALKASHFAGIYNHISLIAGMPSETKKDVLKTSDFITRNREYIDSANVLPLGRYTPPSTKDLLKSASEKRSIRLKRAEQLAKTLAGERIFHRDSIQIMANWPDKQEKSK